MRQPGHEQAVEVGEHCGERLRLVRRRPRQRRADVSRLNLREHGKLADALEVRRDPVDGEGAVRPEVGHLRSFAISRQERVLSTCSFVSQARRAWATPSSR